jgi:hypothetical protein
MIRREDVQLEFRVFGGTGRFGVKKLFGQGALLLRDGFR